MACQAFISGSIHFTALDQDGASVAHTEAELGATVSQASVTGVKASIASLIKQDKQLVSSLGHFDVIYSAGLFDYLPDKPAAALVYSLFQHLLAPGGTLLIANLMNNICCQGYMEQKCSKIGIWCIGTARRWIHWPLLYLSTEYRRRLLLLRALVVCTYRCRSRLSTSPRRWTSSLRRNCQCPPTACYPCGQNSNAVCDEKSALCDNDRAEQ